MIRTLLLDLGNVLVDFSHEQMRRQVGRLCGCTAADVGRLMTDSGLQWDFERGRIGELEFHRRAQAALECNIDPRELHNAVCDIFSPNAEMLALLPRLQEEGYRLVLLSNTSHWHFQWVRDRFDALHVLDECVVSFRVGELKPHRAMYQAALDAIDCRPEECFYTDDIRKFVEGGREFGLQAEVFQGAAKFREHLRDRGVDVC